MLTSEIIYAKKHTKLCISRVTTNHLAGLAVSVGGGTGQEMAMGDQAPTPAAEAAATAECPVQTRQNVQIRERITIYEFTKDRWMA